MKNNDYEIRESWDEDYFEGYEVLGFVRGNFFGILGVFATKVDALVAGDKWAEIDHSTDARVRS